MKILLRHFNRNLYTGCFKKVRTKYECEGQYSSRGTIFDMDPGVALHSE